MTVNERLEDISKISGFSIEIVRKILNAEQESIIESLKKGERATLIGRCTITPCMRQKIKPGMGVRPCIKLHANVSNIISDELEEMEAYEVDEVDI
jgi:hypothetical protein